MHGEPRGILPGYTVPLYQALVTPILIGGAPRLFILSLTTLCVAMAMVFYLYLPAIIFWFVGYIGGVIAAKRDPQFVEVIQRHLQYDRVLK